MTSNKQITANRQNSTKSTGPKSATGKTVSSRNAMHHGILSTRIFLPDEDPKAFQLLFEELTETFKPQGIMEMILVEKIAVAIWKQRRIVSAESAAITLRRQESQLLNLVNNALGKFLPYDKVTSDVLAPIDDDLVSWCKVVQQEWAALVYEKEQEITVKEMKSKAPKSWQELQIEAQNEARTVADFLTNNKKTMYGWLQHTKEFADGIVSKAQFRSKVAELYQAANAELSILPDAPRTSFERYQTTLDNQLYRAIKELRMIQDRRISMIETVLPTGTGEDEISD